MVWESGCVVVVMLTPLSENGVKQCHHYWPDEGSDVYHIYEVCQWKIEQKGYGKTIYRYISLFGSEVMRFMPPSQSNQDEWYLWCSQICKMKFEKFNSGMSWQKAVSMNYRLHWEQFSMETLQVNESQWKLLSNKDTVFANVLLLQLGHHKLSSSVVNIIGIVTEISPISKV